MAYSVWCAYCEKNHFGKQVWNDQLQDYVCYDCKAELEAMNKAQRVLSKHL